MRSFCSAERRSYGTDHSKLSSAILLPSSSASINLFSSSGKEREGRVVHGLACRAGQQRNSQPPMRRGILQDSRPPPRKWSLLVPWHVVRLALHLLLGPGCLRSPWGGVVRNFSQGHGDGHPLMSKPRLRSSLSPPHCGARCDANTSHGQHLKAQQKSPTQNGATCMSLGLSGV